MPTSSPKTKKRRSSSPRGRKRRSSSPRKQKRRVSRSEHKSRSRSRSKERSKLKKSRSSLKASQTAATLEAAIRKWAKGRKRGSEWLGTEDGEIYVRISCRFAPENKRRIKCLDLATWELQPEIQGRGVFTTITKSLAIDMPDGIDRIFIEEVMSERLQKSLTSRGWVVAPGGDSEGPKSYFSPRL